MWNKIKSWFGWADLNKDGKVDAADVKIVQNTVEAKIETAKVVAAETKRRAANVKQELKDVQAAAKEVANQAGDVVAAAKGKKRAGRKPKK